LISNEISLGQLGERLGAIYQISPSNLLAVRPPPYTTVDYAKLKDLEWRSLTHPEITDYPLKRYSGWGPLSTGDLLFIRDGTETIKTLSSKEMTDIRKTFADNSSSMWSSSWLWSSGKESGIKIHRTKRPENVTSDSSSASASSDSGSSSTSASASSTSSSSSTPSSTSGA